MGDPVEGIVPGAGVWKRVIGTVSFGVVGITVSVREGVFVGVMVGETAVGRLAKKGRRPRLSLPVTIAKKTTTTTSPKTKDKILLKFVSI